MESRLLFLIIIGVAIRLYLFNTPVSDWVSEKAEFSSPITSWKRLTEGLILYRIGISPYTGDVYHGMPICLRFWNFVEQTLGQDGVKYFFVALDVTITLFLYWTSLSLAAYELSRQSEEEHTYHPDAKTNLLITVELLERQAFHSAAIYLINPLTVGCCLARNTGAVQSLLIVWTFYWMSKGNRFLACTGLALVSYISIYTNILVLPLALHLAVVEEGMGEVAGKGNGKGTCADSVVGGWGNADTREKMKMRIAEELRRGTERDDGTRRRNVEKLDEGESSKDGRNSGIKNNNNNNNQHKGDRNINWTLASVSFVQTFLCFLSALGLLHYCSFWLEGTDDDNTIQLGTPTSNTSSSSSLSFNPNPTVNPQVSRSWSYLRSTWGFVLSAPDLTPNLGIFWYFFTEMFEHFRSFFVCVFQIHACFVYAIPLLFRFPRQPFFFAFLLLATSGLFKSYPTYRDLSLTLSLATNWSYLVRHFRNWFPAAIGTLVCVLVGPVFWDLWMVVGSANANFYFAITLSYAVCQVFLLTDFFLAFLRRRFELVNGTVPPILAGEGGAEGRPALVILD